MNNFGKATGSEIKKLHINPADKKPLYNP